MKSNNITLKIKYETEKENLDIILSFIKNYNNVLRFTYNRVQEGIKSTKDLTELQKQLNNIFIDSHFKNSSIFEAKSIQDSNLIFGGKKLFLDRCKNKISKEDFKLKRLVPISSVGESNHKGNRKFSIINENTVLFKPTKNIHINLQLKEQGKNYKETLNKLIKLQNNKQIPITYRLDLEYVYITYDNSSLKSNFYKTKKNRVIAIDLNPNYLGYSIVDWLNESSYNIVDEGVYDISKINIIENSLKVSSNDDKKFYIKNKRDYEVVKIAYELAKVCKHYKCEVFSIEELNIRSNNLEKGRRLNMSTRSRIGIQNKDGSIESIYCHFDGYYEGVGRMLVENYTDESTVRELISLGNLSSLGTKPVENKCNWWDDLSEYITNMKCYIKEVMKRHPEGTCDTYRIRGDENSDAIVCSNIEEYKELVNSTWGEYGYLFKDNNWYDVLNDEVLVKEIMNKEE